MNIFAISDLHLSLSKNKPMDIFGDNWANHSVKIEDNWNRIVSKDDITIVAGDISWAMNLKDAMPDLEFLDNLNGRKIVIEGNHDFWWKSPKQLNETFLTIDFMKNRAIELENYIVCGTKGYCLPLEVAQITEQDIKLYKRELLRVKLNLDMATDIHNKTGKEIIFVMHYPPSIAGEMEVLDIIKKHPVSKVVYGHLHADYCENFGIKGTVDGIEYFLTSADYLDFTPIKIS